MRDGMTDFTAIQAGDRVVLQYSGNAITARQVRIETVTRVTPTQIVTGNAPVGRMGRYHRTNGRPIGGGRYWPWITGLATPQQIAAYKAEQAAKSRAAREAREKQEAVDAQERQLAGLFPQPYQPVVRKDGNRFAVEFTLSAAQARRMAAALSKAVLKPKQREEE